MITLNLISPAKKQELRLMQLYIMIKNLIIIILFVTIITAIILLLTKMSLQNYFNDVVAQTTATTKYANLFNEDLKELNQYIKSVDEIQQKYIPWTKFFIGLSKLVPDEINLFSLNLNEGKILITGLAKTRDKLLEFQKNLKNSEFFSEVTIPIDNLLERKDINFSIKANINLENVKNYDD